MSGEALESRKDHVAVNLDHFIVVFGGAAGDAYRSMPLSLRIIWMYNIYTE